MKAKLVIAGLLGGQTNTPLDQKLDIHHNLGRLHTTLIYSNNITKK